MEKPFLKNYSNSQLIININGTAPHDHTTRTMISSLSAERHDTSNNLYNETPSSEPFNVDPDLVRVLNKNQEIIKRSQPRFTLDGKGEDGELESSSLIDIIGRTRLERLAKIKLPHPSLRLSTRILRRVWVAQGRAGLPGD